MKKVLVKELGHISYKDAWDCQQELQTELIERKRRNRKRNEVEEPLEVQHHYFLFCEHPHVYTLGKSGKEHHLLLNEVGLKNQGIEFFKTNRGGDITYHGPGQIVGYPILDLDCFFTDVHKYVRFIEEAIIRTLAEYEIEAYREKGYTGVWLPKSDVLPKRKICAIGIRLSRWVSMHGFAFNVNTDLSYFRGIIPCGIDEAGMDVTSLAAELRQEMDIEVVKQQVLKHFVELFGFEVALEKSM